MFATFVINNFPDTFAKCGNADREDCFLQDNDPSQNSKAAKVALREVDAVQFSIPPRSADCNPIENFFSWVEKELSEQAIRNQITREPIEQFANRVQTTMESCPVAYINNLIESMPRRMEKIIETHQNFYFFYIFMYISNYLCKYFYVYCYM